MTWPDWCGPDRFLREVGPGLFVGAELATDERDWALIVSVGGDPPEDRCRGRVLRHYFDDGDVVPDAVWAMLPEIRATREAGGQVLIHCSAGLSRSPSVAYAILRLHDGLDHEAALRRVEHADYRGRFPVAVTLRSARAHVVAAGICAPLAGLLRP